MNKKGGMIENFIIFLLLIALGFSAYYFFIYYTEFMTQSSSSLVVEREPLTENTIPSKQFYPRMRYSDKVVGYYISPACSDEKKSSMEEAFDTLEAMTVLTFNPVAQTNSVLNILCSDISPAAEERNHFVAGEGGPSRVLNSTLYSVILEGKIALYREGQCNNPNVALHELLHALGFDHNNNRDSILYPTLSCSQEIDEEIIESINELYEEDPNPDLVFSEASAVKNGRYLNFHIEVLNQGLENSLSVAQISVFADGEFMEVFDIGAVSIGSKKILDVENLRVPAGATEIVFVVDNDNRVEEMYENNNDISLTLVEDN